MFAAALSAEFAGVAAGTEFALVTIVSEEAHQRPVDAKYDWNPEGADITTGGFADGFPFLVTLEKSLDALNVWTKGSRVVEMQAFRPNIVLSGGTAWEEDEWRLLQIGEDESNRFWVAKPLRATALREIEKGQQQVKFAIRNS